MAELETGCPCEGCRTLHEMSVAEYVRLLDEQVTSEAEDTVRTREAALAIEMGLRAKRELIAEVQANALARYKFSREHGSGGLSSAAAAAYAVDEVFAKYQEKP